MKSQLYRITLYSILTYFALSAPNSAGAASKPSGVNETLFCGVIDDRWNKRYSDQYTNRRYARASTANLNVGEPRTVRLIYFLPNDRPYRAEVVQKMKEEIKSVQTFYQVQMDAHGFGKMAFRFESDSQGEPKVHRVDGQFRDTHYEGWGDRLNYSGVINEINKMYDLDSNIYFIIIDNSAGYLRGAGSRRGKKGGYALLTSDYFWATAHELGHAFGLQHDFNDDAYIMSYGWGAFGTDGRLSLCHAEYLSVQPYFNLDIPIEEGEGPTIELTSPRTYPAGSQSVPVRLKVNDSDGLHQVILFVRTIKPHSAAGYHEVKACRGLAGDRDTVRFDYDGVIPSDGFTDGFTNLSNPVKHPIFVHAVDTDGNVGYASFELTVIPPHHIATLKAHTKRITSVAFSSDGVTLATGSWDGTVKLWDVETERDIATFRHTGEVTSVAFSSDGVTLATGSWDGTVKLWDVVSQQDIATLKVHTKRIPSMAFSSGGVTLATGSSDGTVKLWDVETERDIATFRHTEGVTSVSFSSDGAILASGSYDGTVKLWDVATRQNIGTFKEHASGRTSVAFSPVDATLLATGSYNGRVNLWDITTGVNFATLWSRHGGGVLSMSFSSDGAILAAGSYNGTVKLWDITTGVNFATLWRWHGDPVLSVAFSSDDTTLATGTEGGTVELWDTSGLMGVRREAVSEIDIPDPNLRAAIAEAIGLPPSTSIFRGPLEYLTRLDARNADISDLTGLEGATNLRTLDLGAEYVEAEGRSINSNSVSDISAVAGLTNLRSLNLWGNSVSDISAVAGLTNLKGLNLENNSISDISAVSGLTNLRSLNLWGNSVSDISAVAGLTNLQSLNLQNNSISDISAVSGLTNLKSLSLGGNSVSDISAVAGLTNLWTLALQNNSISDISAVADLTNLTDLNVGKNSISDISAVAGLTNLRSLNLWGNSVSDISVVAGLTNLTHLHLANNSVSDISAVAGLTNLQSLNLENNSISDISAVSGLTNLRSLNLWGNSVSDISAVAGTNLTYLNLANNSVSDISPVAGLTNLTQLYLSNNAISDVSPLLALNLTGTSWDSTGLYLERNPLSYTSIYTHIPAMQANGVEVKFDNRTVATLFNISGGFTASNNTLTVEVRDSNGRIFEGVPVTFTVTSGGGSLSVTSTTTDENGRAESRLTLGKESNRVNVSVDGAEQTVTFSDAAEGGVHIPDPNLRAAVEKALGVKSGSPISPEEMAALTHFKARDWTEGASISLLTGLEFATNLTELHLGNNSITDVSPLSGLTNLTTLGLGRNSVTDISPLSGLTNLRTLGLSYNGIKDVSAFVSVLSGLTNLTNLHLTGNHITDISFLSGLTGLTVLRLEYNRITDISPLSGLTDLTELRLSGNNITDISPLSGLTNLTRLELPIGITDVPVIVRILSRLPHLTSLNLSDNNIGDVSVLIPVLSDLTDLIDLSLSGTGMTDLSPLTELTHLTGLSLGNNSISDISPLASLTNLTSLHLWNNNISDISPLVENTGLGSGGWSWVMLMQNPLSYQSIHTHIPTLQSRGVTVNFDNQAHPALLKISGDNQRRMPGQTLMNPFVVEAQDENGLVISGISVNFTVTSGDGTLSIQSATTNANGRAQSTLTLGPNLGTYTVQASAVGIEVPATFTAEGSRIPKTLQIISGKDQAGLPGDVLEKAFVVEVRDEFDKPLPGAQVTFTVTSGDGTLSVTSATTDSNGQAESTLTLGPNPGTNTVEATVTGIEEKRTFTAEGSRIPKTLQIISGKDQAGLPGDVLEKAFVVEVRDEFDKPLPGAQVTFTVTSGDGTLSVTSATTDSNGQAESTLTLGPNPGTNTVEATVTGIEEKRTFTAEGSRIPKTLQIISGKDQKGLPGTTLEKPFVVEVRDEFDKPLPGAQVTFTVTSGDGTLSGASVTTDSNGRAETILTLGPNLGKNSVRAGVEGISQPKGFTATGIRPQFDLSLPAGISLIHVSLKATAVDGAPLKIESISDLYDALGGAEKVNFLVTRDAQRWRVYFGAQNIGTSGDKALTDDLGIIAAMKDAVTIRLGGDTLGRAGNSAIRLHPGTNLVGVPLRDSQIMRVSDLLSLEGIRGNVPSIFVSVQGKFVEVRRAADDGNVPITGGQSFVLEAREAATVAISGNAWYNTSGTTVAPLVAVTGIEVGDVTPVLAFSGSVVDEVSVWSGPERGSPLTGSGFRVTVKNLSTGKAVAAVSGDAYVSTPDNVKLIGVGYQLAVVDMESGRAAQVGDVLEVSAESSNQLIRVRPLRHAVTAADVKNSRVQLPELVAYEIPAETALLPNYPNPFNPETWIPYQLAEDADVTLTIYDTRGVTVRRLDLGHQLAGYYADRGKATYWNGRNDNGESVASGLYFYQLGTPSFSHVRGMVILK